MSNGLVVTIVIVAAVIGLAWIGDKVSKAMAEIRKTVKALAIISTIVVGVVITLSVIGGAKVAPPTQSQVQATSCPQVTLNPDQAQLLTSGGVDAAYWGCVDYIFSHESGWCATKWEGEVGQACGAYHGYPSSKGYGICQATPPSKMGELGISDWPTNAVTQVKWCNKYAHDRYGGWPNSYQFWYNHHWW